MRFLRDNRDRIEIAVLVGLCAVLLIPLILTGYIGSFNRYFADDFCFVTNTYDRDLFSYIGQVRQTMQARPSSNFLLYFHPYFDPRSAPALAFIWLIAAVLGLAAGLYWLLRLQNIRHTGWVAVMLAELIVVVMLQVLLKRGDAMRHSFFWLTGVSIYAPPRVFLGLTLGAIFAASQLRWSGWRGAPITLLVGLVALIGGGFSETYTTLMIGLCAALIPILWWVLDAKTRRVVLPMVIIALVANIIMLIVMGSAPRSWQRVLVDPMSPPELAFKSVYQTIWFVDQSFKLSPFSMLTLFVLPTLTVKALKTPQPPRINADQRLKLALLLPVALLIGLICAAAPGVYAMGAPPVRPLTMLTLLLVSGIVAWSIIALPSIRLDLEASTFYRRWRGVAQALTVLVLVAMLVGRDLNDLPEMLNSAREYAAAWDAQAADIHARIERGDPLEGLTGIGITGNPNSITGECAALFFKTEHLETPSP